MNDEHCGTDWSWHGDCAGDWGGDYYDEDYKSSESMSEYIEREYANNPAFESWLKERGYENENSE